MTFRFMGILYAKLWLILYIYDFSFKNVFIYINVPGIMLSALHSFLIHFLNF